jgi:transposase
VTSGSVIREAIEGVGADLLVLTPYIPDFNPTELAFSKLRAMSAKGNLAHD